MADFKQNYFQRRTRDRGPRSNNRINALEVQVINNDGNLLGDLNEDGNLNVLDVVILVNLILSGDDSNQTGDLNQDGNLNILDIVTLVNLILDN